MKRNTTKAHRRNRTNVLEARVMSPRLAWLGLLKFTGNIIKLSFLLAVLTGIGWGIWSGIQHAFYRNPDFRLQVVDLNANPVIDEAGVLALSGIDIAASPSLFDIDVSETTRKLKELPAITHAHVERHLPNTLVVRVTARTPKVWVTELGTDLKTVRHPGGLLLDPAGVAYPCPQMQWEKASLLPVIEVSSSAEHSIHVGHQVSHPELKHCFNLLDSAQKADSQAAHWVESIRQINDWSLRLVTREGTLATFSLSDHKRQMESLRAALNHAADKGYLIDTINLIPKYNIPITIREQSNPPRAIPVSHQTPSNSSVELSSNQQP